MSSPTGHDAFGHVRSDRGVGRRILHLTTRHLRGGAERNVAHFVAWELANGFEVHVAVGRDSDPAGLPAGAHVHRIESLVRDVNPLNDWRAWRELRSLIGRGRYDVLHTHLSKAGVIGRMAGRGRTRRIVHTVHMASFGTGYARLASPVFRALERRCARFTDPMIFVGTGLRDHYLASGVGTLETSLVIHSPIDVDQFIESRLWPADRREAVRQALGVDTRIPLVMTAGILERRKRHDLLLNALRDDLASGSLMVAIAGDGPERLPLEALATEAGGPASVRFLGHLVDIVPILAAADILVLTSTVEGVPQVVIQALAAGRPVVATDVPGLREIAGAPITIVPIDGSGLAEAVAARIADPGSPVEPGALAPWTCSAIDREIAALHERIDQ
jgi:glycosyltransferase involved in cell wall biosynthesis